MVEITEETAKNSLGMTITIYKVIHDGITAAETRDPKIASFLKENYPWLL